MTNERLKDLYIKGVEQDFQIPGGKSFFYQICARKLSVIGDEGTILQAWKQHLLGEEVGKFTKFTPGQMPLFEKIAY